MTKIYNFCAGPAMLPYPVMAKAQQEFVNWNNTGSSIMELSHRSSDFIAVAQQAEADLRQLLSIPDNYKVLFCHGGGRGQFSAVPLNLLPAGKTADYVITGSWSKAAAAEAEKFGNINKIQATDTVNGQKIVTDESTWNFSENAAYVHYCPNETVDGIEMFTVPDTNGIPLVADMSSTILSRKIDVSQFGVIYAGAQKNIGPSGLTIVIVRDDLLDHGETKIPCILDYNLTAKHDSMFNTPPTYAWYLAGLVFEWLKSLGGINAIEKINIEKSNRLYDLIDGCDYYVNTISPAFRSRMNVIFRLANDDDNAEFISQAERAGLTALKGHRSVGGMRASIYNAMPLEGVEKLISFMQAFASQKLKK